MVGRRQPGEREVGRTSGVWSTYVDIGRKNREKSMNYTAIGRKNRETHDHTEEGIETALRGMERSGRRSADYPIGSPTETSSSC
jgi:hypothetical protein